LPELSKVAETLITNRGTFNVRILKKYKFTQTPESSLLRQCELYHKKVIFLKLMIVKLGVLKA
jgi:hypothetical protein